MLNIISVSLYVNFYFIKVNRWILQLKNNLVIIKFLFDMKN